MSNDDALIVCKRSSSLLPAAMLAAYERHQGAIGTDAEADKLILQYGRPFTGIKRPKGYRDRCLLYTSLAEKLSLRDLRLLQQYRHFADKPTAPGFVACWTNNGQRWISARVGYDVNDPNRKSRGHRETVGDDP